jgi:hypothetical protein
MKLSTDPHPRNTLSGNAPRTLVAIDRRCSGNDEHASKVLTRVNAVLQELHVLLEDYSPAWFSQEQHERTEGALRELNRLIPSRPNLSVVQPL